MSDWSFTSEPDVASRGTGPSGNNWSNDDPFYDPPDDRAGTVFDPYDETFGPIMAAIQAGDFEEAIVRLNRLI